MGGPDTAPPTPRAKQKSSSDAGPVTLFAHLGTATPYGGIGLSLEVLANDWIAIEAGVGTNFSAPEAATMARLRVPVRPWSYLTLGSGVSFAKRYVGHEFNGVAGFLQVLESLGEGSTSYAVWAPAYFWNGEIGSETRTGHVVTRVYLGYARVLNPASYTCTEGQIRCSPEKALGLAYFGFALGYSF